MQALTFSSLASSNTSEKRFTFAGLTLSSLSALVQFTGEVCIFYLALGNALRGGKKVSSNGENLWFLITVLFITHI